MDNDEVKKISSVVLKNISLWASQSYIKSLIIIFIFLIFGIPLISYLQDKVRHYNYFAFISFIFDFLYKTFNPLYYTIFIVLILILILLYLINRRLNDNDVIKDNFKYGLDEWAIPLDANWTTENCSEALGKMLTVTNSFYPGTLKGAYSWYDYAISFKTKISKDTPASDQNFTFIIRSESNFNAVMLQITKSHLRPHFIYNSTFIIDNNATQQLPTTLKPDEWIKVKLLVKGNNVDIIINDYKLQYKIPTKVFNVANDVISKGTITLQEIQKSNDDIQDTHNKMLDILRMEASPAREEALKTIKPLMDSIPPYTRIILEYQKGSIGFRQSGKEKAHFRDFQIKKI